MQKHEFLNNYSVYPINSKYTQLSNPDGTWNPNDDPEVQFGGLWELLFANEGTFFKTEGYEPENIYEAGSLIPYRDNNGLSKDKMQRMLGHNAGGRYTSVSSNWFGGIYYRLQSAVYGAGSSRAIQLWGINPGLITRATFSVDGRTEPANRLMRIWRRIN